MCVGVCVSVSVFSKSASAVSGLTYCFGPLVYRPRWTMLDSSLILNHIDGLSPFFLAVSLRAHSQFYLSLFLQMSLIENNNCVT